MNRPNALLRSLLALSGTFFGLAGALAAQGPGPFDPFGAGLRWSHAPDPAAPWIPRDVTFVGDGELVWCAPAIETPKLQLFAAGVLGGATPLWETAELTDAIGEVRVAAGDDPAELFAVAQYPMPFASTRQTRVTRHDARLAAAGGGFGPRWTYTFGGTMNGPAAIASSRDGERLVAAVFDAPRRLLHVAFLDPATGALFALRTLFATSMRELVMSDDGARVAVAAGTVLYVFDHTGATVLALSEPSSTQAIALDADGSFFAHGRAGGVDLYHDVGSGYAFAGSRTGQTNELAMRLAFSDDASRWAVAWWNASDGASVRLELMDRALGTRLVHYTQLGASPSGLQNLPVGLALTPDGERAVLGLWGTGDERPEVVLLEEGVGTLQEADLPGSVEALALSPDGTRIAVAERDTHANQFTTTGVVTLYDTGERALQALGVVRLGERFDVSLAMPQGGAAVFGFGVLDDVPTPTRWGELWLDLAQPNFFQYRPSANGRADAGLTVSSDPALLGLPLAVQALRLVGGQVEWVDRILTPPVL